MGNSQDFIFKKSTGLYCSIAPNVLGYTSETNQREIKTKIDYDLGEMIGRQGIEKTYEKLLRGKKAKNYFKDRFSRIIGPYEGGTFDQTPEAQMVVLTIDANLQALVKLL